MRQRQLEAGNILPPIVTVADVEGEHLVAEGFHRVRAHRAFDKTGQGEIDAFVHPPVEGYTSTQVAIYLSCRSNLDHGLKRSKEDKAKAVRMYLELPWNANRSDRAIAEELKVHRRYVAEGRALLEQGLVNSQESSGGPIGPPENAEDNQQSDESAEPAGRPDQNSGGPIGPPESDEKSGSAIAQPDEPKKRIGKDGKAYAIKPSKSLTKPDKEAPDYMSAPNKMVFDLVENGKATGDQADRYIAAISKFGKDVVEAAEMVEKLFPLMFSVEQQNAALDAIHALIEPLDRCRNAVKDFCGKP